MSGAAFGQSYVCGERDRMVETLKRKYDELPVSFAVVTNGNLLEVLTSQDGETWSLIVTKPDGTACLLSTGENWRKLEPQWGEGS